MVLTIARGYLRLLIENGRVVRASSGRTSNASPSDNANTLVQWLRTINAPRTCLAKDPLPLEFVKDLLGQAA